MEEQVFLDTTPTPSPVSAVQPVASGRLSVPPAGMRRILVGWANSLTHVYADVATLADGRAAALHARHAAAVAAAGALAPVQFGPTPMPLSAAEQAWVKHVTATPLFRTSFGLQGWRVARVPLASLVVWQPMVDAPLDEAPPITTEEEVVQALLPEPPAFHLSKGSVAADGQGGVRAVLMSADPNHDLDISLDDEGAGGLRIRLRPRTNIAHAMPLNGRLVVLNGYNRLVRLAAAGYTDAPILLLDQGHHAAGPIADRPGFLPLQFVTNAPRPPVITDFLDGTLTIDVPKPQIARGHDFRISHAEFPVRL